MFGKIIVPFIIASIFLICTIVFGGQVVDDEERMLWFIRKCKKSNVKNYTFFNIPLVCDKYENVSCKAFKRLNMSLASTIVDCEEGLHVNLDYIQTCGVECDPKEICVAPEIADCENKTIQKPPYDQTCADTLYGKADKCNFYYTCQVGHPNFETEDECNGDFTYEKNPKIVPEKLKNLTVEEMDFCDIYRKKYPNATSCRYEVCDYSVNCGILGPGRYPNPGSCSHYCVCTEVQNNTQYFKNSTYEMVNDEPKQKWVYIQLAFAKECPTGQMFDSRQDSCVIPEKYGCIGL